MPSLVTSQVTPRVLFNHMPDIINTMLNANESRYDLRFYSSQNEFYMRCDSMGHMNTQTDLQAGYSKSHMAAKTQITLDTF